MKDSIRQKLEKAEERFDELNHLLADPELAGNSQQFRDLSMEYARLQPTAAAFADYRRLEQELAAAREMLSDADSDIRTLGEEEITTVEAALEQRDRDLRALLLPQ